MAQSIKGKLVTIKDAPDHWWGGHWGVVIDENLEDDEYFVAGGSMAHTIQSAKKALEAFLEYESLENSPLASCLNDILFLAKQQEALIGGYQDLMPELEKDSAFLGALHKAGVEKWEGYKRAYDIIHEQEQITNHE